MNTEAIAFALSARRVLAAENAQQLQFALILARRQGLPLARAVEIVAPAYRAMRRRDA